MAVGAGLWRGLVKEDHLPVDFFFEGMAHRAGHVLMRSGQGELGALVMVEG